MQTHGGNIRIIKNSIFLYIRMFLSMIIGLYSSRVVLNTLGVEDFGIYNVVGGVVTMFSFLNASMSSASSRFLTMELGRKDNNNVQTVFSASITVHLIVAGIVLFLAETIGLWFVESKLVIPQERLMIARIIYQLSVFSVICNITQVPYNAFIIAHEKLGVFAYIEILNSLLRLVILFILPIIDIDKLLLYGILMSSISIFIAFIYGLYCRLHFSESKFIIGKDKNLLKKILSFSSWDLFGNMSVMARTQGVNLLLNLFFGPLLNAAAAIATSLQGALGAFASNIMTAVKPQIFKRYSNKEYNSAISLMISYTKYSFILLSLLSLPILVETEYILKLWLKTVPDYTVSFCRLTILFNIFANVSSSLMCIIHATGKIKRSSLINGTLYLLVIPVAYVYFKNGGTPVMPYLLNIIFVCIGFTLNSIYLSKCLDEFYSIRFLLMIGKLAFLLLLSYFIVWGTVSIWDTSIFKLLMTIIISTCVICLFSFFFILSITEKIKIKSIVYQWIRKIA